MSKYMSKKPRMLLKVLFSISTFHSLTDPNISSWVVSYLCGNLASSDLSFTWRWSQQEPEIYSLLLVPFHSVIYSVWQKMFHWTLVCIIFQLKNRFFFLSHLIWTWNNVPINERGLMDFSQLKQDQTKVQFFLRNPSLNDLLGFFCQTGGVSVRDIRKFSHRPTSNSCRAHLGTFHKICPVNSIYWYIFIAPPSICNIHSIYVSSTW